MQARHSKFRDALCSLLCLKRVVDIDYPAIRKFRKALRKTMV